MRCDGGNGKDTKDRYGILSLNPVVRGDRFFWVRGSWDRQLGDRLREAAAVIVPQTVDRELYYLCCRLCPRVFPNYHLRFQWEGKVGDTLLFWSFGVPHPMTWVFPRVEAINGDEHLTVGYAGPELPSFPFVVKAAKGGEGRQVWLVHDAGELTRVLSLLEREEWRGNAGFVVQEFLPDLARDLRVVVIGDSMQSYWRCNQGFLHNLAMGGEIDAEGDPELQAAGRRAVADLCRRTGINLAAFDLVFPASADTPLFLEINYTFGRAGLGGSDRYYHQLQEEVDRWLERV